MHHALILPTLYIKNILILLLPPPPPSQVQYEQRCSQLVGLALCTMNFSGKYPEFVRLRGTCYAIRALGETYVMVSKYGSRQWWTQQGH